MSGYEESSLDEITTALDGLGDDATPDEVFHATRPYHPRAIASVAATRGGGAAPAGGVELMGPVEIEFDTAGISDQFKVFDLEAGSVVVRAWAFIEEEWDSGTQAQLTLGVGASDWNSGNWYTLVAYDALCPTGVLNSGVAGTDQPQRGVTDPTSSLVNAGFTTQAGALIANVFQGGSPATQGRAQVYALVAVVA